MSRCENCWRDLRYSDDHIKVGKYHVCDKCVEEHYIGMSWFGYGYNIKFIEKNQIVMKDDIKKALGEFEE